MTAKHEGHASKASEQAMHENDAHNPQNKSQDAVPGEESAHSHSHAAHTGTLGKTNDANESGGSRTGELREPVMDQTRRHDEPQRKNG